jgi:hypothetical protein
VQGEWEGRIENAKDNEEEVRDREKTQDKILLGSLALVAAR